MKKVDRTGEFYNTNEGEKVTIIECFGSNNCTIQFEDGTILREIKHGNIKRGHVRKPVNHVGEIWTSNRGETCEIIELINTKNVTVKFNDGTILYNLNYYDVKDGSIRKSKISIGDKYISFQGYEMTVIESFGATNNTIQFNDIRGTIKTRIATKELKNGNIRNPYHPSVNGVGFYGQGIYNSAEHPKACSSWRSIMQRCYDENLRYKNPTYKDVEICEEWQCFQNFAQWFENNYRKGLHLDKDILCPECKIYSPDTCDFVPRKINNWFKNHRVREGLSTGVYKSGKKFMVYINSKSLGTYTSEKEASDRFKTKKQEIIRNLAIEYKEVLSIKMYNRLINY